LLPLIVTSVPVGPDCGAIAVIAGAGVTVKGIAALGTPFTVTTRSPEVAPDGTVTVMLVSLQLTAAPASTPWKLTVLFPWLAPHPLPVIVTVDPAGPAVVERLVTAGLTAPPPAVSLPIDKNVPGAL